MRLPHSSVGRCALLVFLCVGFPPLAGAQSTSDQFWPELDGYYSFNSRYRLGVIASRSTDGASYNSIEVGPTLNIFAKRFLRPRITTNNGAKSNLLVFGIGYRYLAGINQAPENRIELDATPQIPLPWRIQGADRSRIDLRFIESTRLDFISQPGRGTQEFFWPQSLANARAGTEGERLLREANRYHAPRVP